MRGVFVGREPELAAVSAAVDGAVAGRGGMVLIVGEPGIGKTTLAANIAARAEARGADVRWGRCVEFEGAPVYWCWRQVIREWAESRPADAVADALGPGAADIARVVPELAHLGCAAVGDSTEEDDDARFRLFDSVARWLGRAAAERPLVIVLEDLHWSDAASLRLLEFVATSLSETGALVLATYRDAEAAPGTPLAHALGSLRRGPSTHHVSLAGLSEADVATLAAEAHGQTLGPAAAAAVRSHTDGNPFFVTEVLRLLAAEDHVADVESVRLHVPPGVRPVILRRIHQLGDEAEHILTLAAVVGARFDAGVVARVADSRVDVVDKVVDRAVGAALLAEDEGGPHRYRFVHALVREALYEQIPRARKAALHRVAGEAIEAMAGEDPESIAALAADFLAAAPTGVADKAVHYARAVAEQAAHRLALEEAIGLYRAALELWPARDAQRVGLLLGLGQACFYVDDASGSREALLAAADLACEQGDPRAMAAALLSIGSGRFRGSLWDVPVPLLEANIRLLGDDDPCLRAQLIGRMSDMVLDRDEGFRLASEAVELARTLDDPDTRVWTLTRYLIAFPYADSIEARRGLVEELLAVATACVDKQRGFDARAVRMRLMVECGDLDAALAEAERLDGDVDSGRGSLLLGMTQPVATNVATVRGEFQEAQQHMLGLLERAGERGRSEAVQAMFQVQMLGLLWQQGVLEGLRAALEEVIAAFEDDSTVYPYAGALLLDAELGRVDEATALLHRRVGPDLLAWPGGWGGNDVFELAWITEACGLLGDATFADRLHELLAPAADRLIVAAMPPSLAAGWGTMSLGIIAGLLRRYDEAEAHFADALGHHEAMGAKVLVARTKLHWARTVADRGDVERALALAVEARDLSGELGMASVAAHAAALVDRLAPMAVAVAAAPPPPADAAVFRREGEFWTVTFAGSTARLKDTKGMRHLADLLASPGAERHVLDLVASAEGRGTGMHVADDDAGPLLDPQAKEAYRRRIAELTEERDEAKAFNDLARADRAEEELEALISHLSGAVGLGGRDRHAASSSERARISVSRSVKSALARIADALPALGAHLSATVRTGTFCSYVPDARVPTTWEL